VGLWSACVVVWLWGDDDVSAGVSYGLHFHLRQFSALLKASKAVLKIVLLIFLRR